MYVKLKTNKTNVGEPMKYLYYKGYAIEVYRNSNNYISYRFNRMSFKTYESLKSYIDNKQLLKAG